MKRKFSKFLISFLLPIIVSIQFCSYADVDFSKLKKHELYRNEKMGFDNISEIDPTIKMKDYSNEYFSISIPENYTQISDCFFTDENGNNINIQIISNDIEVTNPYTEKNLDEIVKSVEESIKEEVINALQEEVGNYLSYNEINELSDSFQMTIETKQISEFTLNNYKCFHILTNCLLGDYNYFGDQYVTISGNNAYILTFTVQNKDDLGGPNITQIKNSFTIKNYVEPSENESFFSDKLIERIITAVIVGAIYGIGAEIGKRRKKKNEDSDKD